MVGFHTELTESGKPKSERFVLLAEGGLDGEGNR